VKGSKSEKTHAATFTKVACETRGRS